MQTHSLAVFSVVLHAVSIGCGYIVSLSICSVFHYVALSERCDIGFVIIYAFVLLWCGIISYFSLYFTIISAASSLHCVKP